MEGIAGDTCWATLKLFYAVDGSADDAKMVLAYNWLHRVHDTQMDMKPKYVQTNIQINPEQHSFQICPVCELNPWNPAAQVECSTNWATRAVQQAQSLK